jgi:hypothetical protein
MYSWSVPSETGSYCLRWLQIQDGMISVQPLSLPASR